MKNIKNVLLCAITIACPMSCCLPNSDDDFENNQSLIVHDLSCKDFMQESDPVSAANLLFKQCYQAQQAYLVPSSVSDIYDKNSQTYPMCDYVQTLGADAQPHLVSIRQALQKALMIVHEKLHIKVKYFEFIKRGYLGFWSSKVDLHAVAHELMKYDAHVSLLCLEQMSEKITIENAPEENSAMIFKAAAGMLLFTIAYRLVAPYIWTTISPEKADDPDDTGHVSDQMTDKTDKQGIQDELSAVIKAEIAPPSDKKRTWAQFAVDMQNNAQKEFQGYCAYFNVRTDESDQSDVEKIDDEDPDSNWAAEWERQNKEDEAYRQARQPVDPVDAQENIWKSLFKTLCNRFDWTDGYGAMESDDEDASCKKCSRQQSPRSRVEASKKKMQRYVVIDVIDEIIDKVVKEVEGKEKATEEEIRRFEDEIEIQGRRERIRIAQEIYNAQLSRLKEAADEIKVVGEGFQNASSLIAETLKNIETHLTESSEEDSDRGESVSSESQEQESHDHGETASTNQKQFIDPAAREHHDEAIERVDLLDQQNIQNEEVEEPAQVELERMEYDFDPVSVQLFRNIDDTPEESSQISPAAENS